MHAAKLCTEKSSLFSKFIRSDQGVFRCWHNWRLKKTKLSELVSNDGFFIETEIKTINELKNLDEPELQTVSYSGYNKDVFAGLATELNLHGMDRFVTMGKGLEPGLLWDGHDMIIEMTRSISFL